MATPSPTRGNKNKKRWIAEHRLYYRTTKTGIVLITRSLNLPTSLPRGDQEVEKWNRFHTGMNQNLLSTQPLDTTTAHHVKVHSRRSRNDPSLLELLDSSGPESPYNEMVDTMWRQAYARRARGFFSTPAGRVRATCRRVRRARAAFSKSRRKYVPEVSLDTLPERRASLPRVRRTA